MHADRDKAGDSLEAVSASDPRQVEKGPRRQEGTWSLVLTFLQVSATGLPATAQ